VINSRRRAVVLSAIRRLLPPRKQKAKGIQQARVRHHESGDAGNHVLLKREHVDGVRGPLGAGVLIDGMPDQMGPATTQMPGAPATEVAWLEPYPDSDLEGGADDAPDPEARYASRQAVQLAFVAAIQELPPRQRAALMLCDVLGWAAAEAATLLGGSTASINSKAGAARACGGRAH
jgi:hypothetical protein